MKKIKMIITSVIVLTLVGSAFSWKANKSAIFCVTTAGGSGNCYTIMSKRTTVGVTLKYVPSWDGLVCNNSSPCTIIATFTAD